MKRLFAAALILVGIPCVLYLVALWIDFWINRSVGQWMACGMGIPIAVVVALAVIGSLSSAASSPEPASKHFEDAKDDANEEGFRAGLIEAKNIADECRAAECDCYERIEAAAALILGTQTAGQRNRQSERSLKNSTIGQT